MCVCVCDRIFLGHCGNLKIMAWVGIKAMLDLHLSPSHLSSCHNLQREREAQRQEAREREAYFLPTIQRTKTLFLKQKSGLIDVQNYISYEYFVFQYYKKKFPP